MWGEHQPSDTLGVHNRAEGTACTLGVHEGDSPILITKDEDFTLLRMPSQGGRKVARGTTACEGEKKGLEQNSDLSSEKKLRW